MNSNVQLYAGAVLVMLAVLLALWFLLGDKLFGSKDAKSSADLISEATLKGRKVDDPKVKEQLNLLNRTRGQFAEKTGSRLEALNFGKKLRRKLERAGSKLRPAEFIILSIGVGIVVVGVAYVLRGPIAAGLAVFLSAMGARFSLNRRLNKRQSAFADQLPDLLQMMSTNLRAGQSLNQTINSVAVEARSPMKEELQRVVIEQRIGRDLTASFKDLTDRMESKDFSWVVSAIDINRTVGGDLATILGRVESTIRARNKVRGQVAAMSAEGKLSGGVLILLPPGLMFVVQLINPGYLEPMFGTFYGKIAVGLAATMLAVGAFWLKKISEFTY